MASNFCRACRIAWPCDRADFISFSTRRDFRRICAACLEPLEHMPYKEPVTLERARSAAGWSEFVRREQRREKKRIADGGKSPEELGRLDAELQFKEQEGIRLDLEKVMEMETTEPGRVWHRRNKVKSRSKSSSTG